MSGAKHILRGTLTFLARSARRRGTAKHDWWVSVDRDRGGRGIVGCPYPPKGSGLGQVSVPVGLASDDRSLLPARLGIFFGEFGLLDALCCFCQKGTANPPFWSGKSPVGCFAGISSWWGRSQNLRSRGLSPRVVVEKIKIKK